MTIVLMGLAFAGGCVAWQYFGPKAMTWIKGSEAVATSLEAKAKALRAAL